MRRLREGAQVRNRLPLVLVGPRRAGRLRVVLPLLGPEELALEPRGQEADRRWGLVLPECRKQAIRTPAR
jgi:hypothetical protein